MRAIHQGEVIEVPAGSGEAEFTSPDGGSATVASFIKADGRRYARYSSRAVGTHAYASGGERGRFEVAPYSGGNPLYLHGAVRPSGDGRTLSHEDGEPFFYLADTWWMGLTERLTFPEGFNALAADRAGKGFTAVQIVAGLYPDMEPFDDRGRNEAGFPWDRDFTEIRPAYFDAADERIARLCELGIVPCVVGCWGYYVNYAGVPAIRRHWANLIARWGAYPVIWCLAGEALMPFYKDLAATDREASKAYGIATRAKWTEIARSVREGDPFRRLITIHPTERGREQVDDDSLIDLEMLQTGHGGYTSIAWSQRSVRECVGKGMPVINGEACYEGICGSSLADVQRYLFCSNVLSGACGHTYGANGIWQLNAEDKPYGLSPHGSSWGDTPWREAMGLPGSSHIGACKRFLMRFRWSEFAPRQDWVARPCSLDAADGLFCAGIEGEARVIFKPFFGGSFWGEETILSVDGEYHAYLFDPIGDRIFPIGRIAPDAEGKWVSPRTPLFQDWLIALTKAPLSGVGGAP